MVTVLRTLPIRAAVPFYQLRSLLLGGLFGLSLSLSLDGGRDGDGTGAGGGAGLADGPDAGRQKPPAAPQEGGGREQGAFRLLRTVALLKTPARRGFQVRRCKIRYKKTMKIKEITAVIEQFAPLAWQEEYDNSGLVVGRPDDEVHRALLAVDVTEAVLDEAEREGCDFVITHHPIIFHPLKRQE